MNFEKLVGRPVRPGNQVHHTIPQKYRREALELGVNIDQPWHGIEITEVYHRSITRRHEKDWDTFFDLPNLNLDKLLRYEQSMLKKYRLKPGSYLELELIK